MRVNTPFMPAIQPEEPITHYILRLLSFLDAEQRRRILQTQGSRRKVRPSWILPTNLDSVAEILGDGWKADVLTRKHTLAPLFHAFLDQETSCGLQALVCGGNPYKSTFNIETVYAGRRQIWGLALCPKCVEHSEKNAGTHVVKRAHQLLSLSICHRHGEPLLEVCRACVWKNQESLNPFISSTNCGCGKAFRSRSEGVRSSEREKDVRLGEVVQALLHCDLSMPVGNDLAVQIQKKAAAHGLLRFKDRSRLVNEFMCDTLGAEFVARHGIKLSDKGSFYRRIRRGEPIQNPMVGSALVLALLGEGFTIGAENDQAINEGQLKPSSKRDRLAWERLADETGMVQVGKEAVSVSDFQLHCRALLADRMALFPGASRSAVLEQLPKRVGRWLRTRDAKYLNSRLPTIHYLLRNKASHWNDHWQAFDISLVAYMRRQHEAIWQAQADRPFRVSVVQLVAGHPRGRALRWSEDPIPQARAARVELEETRPQFRKRILRRLWVLSGRYRDEGTAMERIAPLSDDQVRRALRSVRTIMGRKARS